MWGFGFNAKENDDEVKGAGNQQDYGFRMYDNRIGRPPSIDQGGIWKREKMIEFYEYIKSQRINFR